MQASTSSSCSWTMITPINNYADQKPSAEYPHCSANRSRGRSMHGATELNKVKDWWSTFSRSVVDAVRSAGAMVASMVSRKDAPPAVAEARPRREQRQQAEGRPHG